MKKLISCVLALVLLCCSASVAETLDIQPEDFTVDLSVSRLSGLKLTDTSFAAGADTVVRVDDEYTVDDGQMKYIMDMGGHPSVLCFTQDLMSSFEAYLRLGEPSLFCEYLVSEGIHYYFTDLETGMEVCVYNHEEDKMSKLAGNFSTLTDANQALLAGMIVSSPVIKTAGETDWIQLEDRGFLTIFNGQYVVVEIGGTGDAEGDAEDTLDLLSSLNLM